MAIFNTRQNSLAFPEFFLTVRQDFKCMMRFKFAETQDIFLTFKQAFFIGHSTLINIVILSASAEFIGCSLTVHVL